MTSSDSEFDKAVLESGRLLFARQWEFIRSVPAMKFLPPEGPVEISFAGSVQMWESHR